MKQRSFSIGCFLLCLNLFSPTAFFAQSGNNSVPVNYSYPAPNSTYVSAKTTIGVRYKEAISKTTFQISAFNVIGSSSHVHTGKLILALDGRTVIFTPDLTFSAGEKVTVIISPFQCVSGKNTIPYSFSFQISKSKMLPSSLGMRPLLSDDISYVKPELNIFHPAITASNGADTLPDDFPRITVSARNNPAPGDIYLGNFIT